jgi:hypothetical protein
MKYFTKLNTQEREFNKQHILNLEERYNFNFPECFHEFIVNYKVGQYLEKWDSYLDSYLRPTPIYRIIIKTTNSNLAYNWISSLNQIEHDLLFFPDALDLLQNDYLLRIGDINELGGLFLGVGNNNKDLIYKYSYGKDDSPILIFDSILNFTEAIYLETEDLNMAIKQEEGKRYFEKEGVQFFNSSFINNLDNMERLTHNYISSDDLICSLKKVIKNV